MTEQTSPDPHDHPVGTSCRHSCPGWVHEPTCAELEPAPTRHDLDRDARDESANELGENGAGGPPSTPATLAGIEIKIDDTIAEGELQLRNARGEVLARFSNIGDPNDADVAAIMRGLLEQNREPWAATKTVTQPKPDQPQNTEPAGYDYDDAIAQTRAAMRLTSPMHLSIVKVAEDLDRHFRKHFTDEELPIVIRAMLMSTASLGSVAVEANCPTAMNVLNVQAVAAVLLTDHLAMGDRR